MIKRQSRWLITSWHRQHAMYWNSIFRKPKTATVDNNERTVRMHWHLYHITTDHYLVLLEPIDVVANGWAARNYVPLIFLYKMSSAEKWWKHSGDKRTKYL